MILDAMLKFGVMFHALQDEGHEKLNQEVP